MPEATKQGNDQTSESILLVVTALAFKAIRFARQLAMAYTLGVSASVDLLLAAQLLPTVIVATFNPGEIVVALRNETGKISPRLVSLFAVLVAVLGAVAAAIAVAGIGLIARLYGINGDAYETFRLVSLILLLNVVPSIGISLGTFRAYAEGKYEAYAKVAIGGEIVGLVVLLVMLPTAGVLAFPIATLIVSITTAALLFRLIPLDIPSLATFTSNRELIRDVLDLSRKLSSLSGQVIVSYFGSFVERTICLRVLSSGYLSAVGYSQSLFELPSTTITGSIGTTTYVRQTSLMSRNVEFEEYSHRIFNILFAFSAMAQLVFMAAAPLLVIGLLRRGKFDHAAVEVTLPIIEILGLALLSAVLTSFFERTLYSAQEFRKVLLIIVVKSLARSALLMAAIFGVPNAVPIAASASISIGAFLSASMVRKRTGIQFFTNTHKFCYSLLLVASLAIIPVNRVLLPWYSQLNMNSLVLLGSMAAMVTCLSLRFVARRIKDWAARMTVRVNPQAAEQL